MNRFRGMTLIDLLLAVSLLGVFSLMAVELLRSSVHMTEQTLVDDSNAARFDLALRALRLDVLESTSVEIPAPALLRIHSTNHQIVEWRSDSSTLSRSTSSNKRAWKVGQPVALTIDGAIVLVSPNGSDHIAMASRHNGGRP